MEQQKPQWKIEHLISVTLCVLNSVVSVFKYFLTTEVATPKPRGTQSIHRILKRSRKRKLKQKMNSCPFPVGDHGWVFAGPAGVAGG